VPDQVRTREQKGRSRSGIIQPTQNAESGKKLAKVMTETKCRKWQELGSLYIFARDSAPFTDERIMMQVCS
jgi:hypothetical protein